MVGVSAIRVFAHPAFQCFLTLCFFACKEIKVGRDVEVTAQAIGYVGLYVVVHGKTVSISTP